MVQWLNSESISVLYLSLRVGLIRAFIFTFEEDFRSSEKPTLRIDGGGGGTFSRIQSLPDLQWYTYVTRTLRGDRLKGCCFKMFSWKSVAYMCLHEAFEIQYCQDCSNDLKDSSKYIQSISRKLQKICNLNCSLEPFRMYAPHFSSMWNIFSKKCRKCTKK